MEGLYLDEKEHIYYYLGQRKKCSSDILQIIDSIALQGVPVDTLRKAADRGTRVHEETENLDYGLLDLLDEDWQEENFDIINYIYAYANFLKEHPELPIASEESIYSEEYNFAGTIDLVKFIDGKLSIIDKKTSKAISKLRSEVQLNAYRLLWNELHPNMPIEALFILQLKDNAEHRLIPIEINEEIFLKYLSIFNEIKGDEKI